MKIHLQRKTAVQIKAKNTGCLLLDFLSARFTYRTPEEWKQEIQRERFLLNNQVSSCRSVLKEGDILEYLLPELQEPPINRDIGFLYEDEDILVIDKPAHLPCHPGGRFFRHTLWALLQEKYAIRNPLFINRLDRETSGIVLIAKNKQAARFCSMLFAKHLVRKDYQVLVEGKISFTELHADGFLGPDPTSLIRKKLRFYPADAPAIPDTALTCNTLFRLQNCGAEVTLLSAQLLTGRTHQIRATLFSLGLPVVGDKLYGLDERLFLRFLQGCLTPEDHRLLRLDRQALHAASLQMCHPRKNVQLLFTAPLPESFRQLLIRKEKGCPENSGPAHGTI